MRPWSSTTTTVVWSSTKAITSLVMAKLVDDGYCSYGDLVIKYWPEFGANGKANVTIGMLMSHRAGLAALDEDITLEIAGDHQRLGEILANQSPNWPPGTAQFGYHAFTLGWLVSQMVSRVDPKKRDLKAYVNEEIMGKFDIAGCYIGLPHDEEHTVARMVHGNLDDVIATITQSWPVFIALSKLALFPSALFERATQNPHYTFGKTFRRLNGYNNPDVHRVENGGAGGICTARALAAPFDALLQGRILSQEAILYHKDPLFVKRIDSITGFPESFGMGWMYAKNPKVMFKF